MANKRRQRYIRASEIGTYIYCRRAWWLRQVAGFEPVGKEEAFAEGQAAHLKHGQAVRRAQSQRRLALLLLIFSFLLFAVAIFALLH